ncbi:DUF1464 family protein [soil metagenome]
MLRVVGSDPGTSSLDLLLLQDGSVLEQARLDPGCDPAELLSTLRRWAPLDLIAGPSGYGLPLIRAEDLTVRDEELMALVRPEERGRTLGVPGFSNWVQALADSGLPVVFLPGGIHLPTIPKHRKGNAIDLGTPDKLAVAALALRLDAERSGRPPTESTFALIEVGSAFSAVLVIEQGRLVDASAGTRGPIGVRCAGAWDGEAACWLSPLSKADLFRGGLDDLGDDGPPAFFESLTRSVAGLQAVTTFDRLYLSGAAAHRPDLADGLQATLSRFGRVVSLPNLPGAWIKHSAQGAALLADGLAGGKNADLVNVLRLRDASGTVLDHLHFR